ncbi:MAG: hypothetical protein U0936_23130 [Planctomycetaceae bacterium]
MQPNPQSGKFQRTIYASANRPTYRAQFVLPLLCVYSRTTIDLPLPTDSYDFNPYAAPAVVPDPPVDLTAPVRMPWSHRLVVFQSFVIVISLAVEAYEHESIVGSGPIFSAVGLAIVICAVRQRDYTATLIGGSAIAFASLIVFLINYNSWGPPEGDQPITILSFAYAVCMLPMSAWFVFAKRKTAANKTMHSEMR